MCEPLFDYGRTEATWSVEHDGGHRRRDRRRRQIRLYTDLSVGVEGGASGRDVTGPATGRSAPCPGRETSPAPRTRTRLPPGSTRRSGSGAWLGRARIPDHRWRIRSSVRHWSSRASRTCRRGRRSRPSRPRCPTTVASELGLPVHMDAGRDLHAAGPALAEPRLGGRRVRLVHRRPRAQRRRRDADPCRIDGRRDLTEITLDELSGTRGRVPSASATARTTSVRTTPSEPSSTRS